MDLPQSKGNFRSDEIHADSTNDGAAGDINNGFDRLERGHVRYRLVIDMATLTPPVGDNARSQ
jgi:sulfur transfer protein SufE